MDNSIQAVELNFQKADQELTWILSTLEQQFAEQQSADPKAVNPVAVLQRLQRLRADLATVEQEHRLLSREKQALADVCRDTLIPCFEQLRQLADASGYPHAVDASRAEAAQAQMQAIHAQGAL